MYVRISTLEESEKLYPKIAGREKYSGDVVLTSASTEEWEEILGIPEIVEQIFGHETIHGALRNIGEQIASESMDVLKKWFKRMDLID